MSEFATIQIEIGTDSAALIPTEVKLGAFGGQATLYTITTHPSNPVSIQLRLPAGYEPWKYRLRNEDMEEPDYFLTETGGVWETQHLPRIPSIRFS